MKKSFLFRSYTIISTLILIVAVYSCRHEPVKVTAVTLDASSIELVEGTTFSLTATISPSNADNQNIMWTTDNAAIATVKDGTVTAVKAGITKISVITDDGGKTAVCEVSVIALVEGITLNRSSVELIEGEEYTLIATISPSNANNKNILWSSSNCDVASVSEGKVTALQTGKTVITAATEDGNKTAICDIIVKPKNLACISNESVTATSITLSGYLNAPISDVPFSEVIIYYSDMEDFNIVTSKKHLVPLSADGRFTTTIPGLKHDTEYQYCIYAKVRSEETYGELCDFTTNYVNVELYNVIPGGRSAHITGKVLGLDNKDLSFLEIGVAYTTSLELMENKNVSHIPAVIVNDASMAEIDIENLLGNTLHYFAFYIKQNNDYKYSDTFEFSTLDNYADAHKDLNTSNALDLSVRGAANSYIISESGLYKFLPFKGNGLSIVENIYVCDILWESYGTSAEISPLDLISGICYKDGYVIFQTSEKYKEGNAVIAAKDLKGTVLWSWHIWFTDNPKEIKYSDRDGNNICTMMDRNLGATSDEVGDVTSYGLFYQWGRKDPFIGSSTSQSRYEYEETPTTVTWPESVPSDSNTGTIEYAIHHPMTFIDGNQIDYDWHDSHDDTMWSEEKTIYDPCPSGWRVAKGGYDGEWIKILTSKYTNTDTSINDGVLLERRDDGTISWFPAAGLRTSSGKDGLMSITWHAYYWSTTPCSDKPFHSYTWTLEGGSGNGFYFIYPCSRVARQNGCSVRCVKE